MSTESTEGTRKPGPAKAKAAQDEPKPRTKRIKIVHGRYWISANEIHDVGAVVEVETAEAERMIESGLAKAAR